MHVNDKKKFSYRFIKNLIDFLVIVYFFIITSIFFSFTILFSQEREKIDGVAAVIGDFVVLDSDIDKQFTQLRVSGVSMENISKCQVFGKLLEDKLYQHHAIQENLAL